MKSMMRFHYTTSIVKISQLTYICPQGDANLYNSLKYLLIERPNGLRYWRWGGRGLCLGAEKTRSEENA
jgi:hypothetical protein